MTFKEQRLAFAETLKGCYPPGEIKSFFYLLTEYHFRYNRFETHQKDKDLFPAEKTHVFENALVRIKNNEPIQYILGETEFYGLTFQVTKDTLIPRTETEELVEFVISETGTHNSEIEILDIGTGSGCIAISLSKNLLNARLSALDFSGEALEVAEDNAEMHNVNVRFIKADILQTLQLDREYDIIVSNPPYVRDLEKKLMQLNVLDFEPASALFVRDNNPLLFYRKIAELAVTSLKANGLLFFEINEYLALEMIAMLEELSFIEIKVKKDVYGKDRIIKCKMK
jgi:release factor glutamine methyltransferase